MQHNQAEQKH